MKSIQCDRCMGSGWVPHENERAKVDCPDCDGDGWHMVPERLDRLIGVDRAARVRRPWHIARRRYERGREMWRGRNAQVMAATVTVHREALLDQPRLRNVIDNDLRAKLEAGTPLGWRAYDLRWCWANVKRAVHGQAMLDLPYDEKVELGVRQSDIIFGDTKAVILAERRRVANGPE